jgi:hypothetical protein
MPSLRGVDAAAEIQLSFLLRGNSGTISVLNVRCLAFSRIGLQWPEQGHCVCIHPRASWGTSFTALCSHFPLGYMAAIPFILPSSPVASYNPVYKWIFRRLCSLPYNQLLWAESFLRSCQPISISSQKTVFTLAYFNRRWLRWRQQTGLNPLFLCRVFRGPLQLQSLPRYALYIFLNLGCLHPVACVRSGGWGFYSIYTTLLS